MAVPPVSLFNRFGATSLRRQLTAIAGGAVLLIAVASTIVSSWQGSRQTRDTLVEQGLSLAGILAEQSRLALLTGAGENARDAVTTALAFPDVVRVEIFHADGRSLLASDGRASGPVELPAEGLVRPSLTQETNGAWRFVAPVRTVAGNGDPFAEGGKRSELLGYVSVIQGKATLSRLVAQLVAVNIAIGIAFAALFLWLLRAMARHLAQPVNNLAAAMAEAEAGQRGLRAAIEGPKDIAHMAHAFNSMMAALEDREHELEQKHEQLRQHAATLEQRVVERTEALSASNTELRRALDTLKATQESLIAAEKQASLGRLVAGVAHELNTPLGNSLTVLSALSDDYAELARLIDGDKVRRSDLARLVARTRDGYEILARGLQRSARIVHDFKQIAVDQTSEKRRVFELAEVVREVLASVQPSYKPTPYRIETALEPDITLDSYPGPLGQVITNIVLNALTHAFPGRPSGTLRVECRRAAAGFAELVFADDGAGMDDAVQKHIFDPFFTTRFGQGGSGLGLHIVHGIVTKLLAGQIEVVSASGRGTQFTVNIPLITPEKEAAR